MRQILECYFLHMVLLASKLVQRWPLDQLARHPRLPSILLWFFLLSPAICLLFDLFGAGIINCFVYVKCLMLLCSGRRIL